MILLDLVHAVVSSIKNLDNRLLVISTNYYKVKEALEENKIKEI